MDLSPFIKRLPLIFRAGAFLNIATGAVDSVRLCCCLICWGAIIVTHVFTMEWERHAIPTRAIYESFVFACNILFVPCLLSNISKLSAFIKVVLQPFHEFEVNSHRMEIIQEYVTGVHRFAAICIFYNCGFVCTFSIGLWPLFTLPFYLGNTTIEDLPLPVGRIPFHTESYFLYAVAYAISFSAIVTTALFHISWYLPMLFSILRVKAQIRLLVGSLECLDQRVEHRLARGGSRGSQLLERCTHDCLIESVKIHVEVIEYVGIFRRCFRTFLLILFQGFMIIMAVLVFQGIDNLKTGSYETQEMMTDVAITIAAMIVFGIFSYGGQIILNESKRLHFALYRCQWFTKPKVFKTSLLIMMTVATRPLHLTVGGLYPLSMESYRNVMKAVYSYINLLLTIQKET